MERRSNRPTNTAPTIVGGPVVDARMSLALWLRAGRAQKGMSLESVAKVTKIQPRILERLEAGKLDGLPAEVFVRGFIRSFAKCVGLDEGEALKRYTEAAGAPQAPSAAARAFVESMSELAPAASARVAKDLAAGSARDLRADAILEAEILEAARLDTLRQETERTQAARAETLRIGAARIEADRVEAERLVVIAAETARAEATMPTESMQAGTMHGDIASGGKKKRGRRGGKGRSKRPSIATGTPSSALPVVEARESVVDASTLVASLPSTTVLPRIEVPVEPFVAGAEGSTPTSVIEVVEEPVVATESWTPKMPTVVAPSVPWRRPYASLGARTPVVPSLVIDDADPDSADREREDRVSAKEPGRRSFLPPILLDREDRTARQGGLTLAVIILLIAATLTLSYLMRRPSSAGDGVTMADDVARDILA